MAEPNPDDAKARERERRRQYRAANRDKINAQKRAWHAANRDEVGERSRRYREASSEKIREQRRDYYLANRDKISEQHREYYRANRQERLEAVKAYAEANPDKIRNYRRRYYAVNGDKVRMETRRRTHGVNFDAVWAAMWEAQQGLCYLCERPMDPDEAFLEHWHGCPGHSPEKSCRYCQRGLAHQNCNFVVGHAGDDPDLLRAIARNLERANADIAERQATMPEPITLF